MSRRGWTRRAVMAAAAAAPLASAPVALTPAELVTLDALCECLIPADDAPGARSARVAEYIDRQLSGRLQGLLERYRAGLTALDQAARSRHDQPFAQLAPERQTGLLELIERGQLPAEAWPEQAQRAFFGAVLDHTMQGFYGSPKYGGNHKNASWRMLGIEAEMAEGAHGGHKA